VFGRCFVIFGKVADIHKIIHELRHSRAFHSDFVRNLFIRPAGQPQFEDPAVAIRLGVLVDTR